jgi:hypothetical protein
MEQLYRCLWLYFPGLKVGDKIDIYSSFWKILGGVD